MPLKPYTIEVVERTTTKYTATLTDPDGAAIALASVGTIKITLIDVATAATINSRAGQDAKNANNVTLHATSGLLTWEIQAADTAMVGSPDAGEIEEHLATISVVWNTSKEMHREVLLKCQSLRSVPQA